MFIILKTNYFLLRFLYKNDLRISTTGKHLDISEFNTFKPNKRQYLPYY